MEISMRKSSNLSANKSGGRWFRLPTPVVALIALSITSCNRGPARVLPPAISASGAASQALELYDTDGDGYMAAAELDKAPGLKAAMETVDTDKDGKVSADEIEQRIEAWQATRIGVATIMCLLRMDGQPLVGADITFEPENFLGDAIQPAIGTSDFAGAAYPRIPKEKRPMADMPGGMQLGFYRIRVSKPANGKETIPAKYNTATTLGQQISPDDPTIQKQQKIVLDLKSH
jgi:hypothetical protein